MNKIEEIWNRYHSGLHGFIMRRVRDASVADDILQDVFERIQSSIGTLREGNKVLSWIYRITRNAIIDHYRAPQRTTALPEDLVYPETDPADQTRREIEDCLLPLIESLPDPYREVLMASEMGGLSHKKVAAKMGLSVSGVKSRVRRGRAMVKKLLMDCCRFEFDHRGHVTDYERKGESCGPC